MPHHLDQVLLKGNRVVLRSIQDEDLPELWALIYQDELPEWKEWDSPFYPLEPHTLESYRSHEQARKRRVEAGEVDSRLIIEVNSEIIGTVMYYWEHKPSLWLEVGLGIYKPEFWNSGYGTEALVLWITHLFSRMPVSRIGLTTWSKNVRMIKAAEKIGMRLEGRLRNCHIYNGVYYDAIYMGVLREEWPNR